MNTQNNYVNNMFPQDRSNLLGTLRKLGIEIPKKDAIIARNTPFERFVKLVDVRESHLILAIKTIKATAKNAYANTRIKTMENHLEKMIEYGMKG